MTIKTLIESLQGYDPEREIHIFHTGSDYWYDLDVVRERLPNGPDGAPLQDGLPVYEEGSPGDPVLCVSG